MLRVSVAVMHDPRRADLLPDLLAALDIDDPVVVRDRWQSKWDTGRRSLLAYDSGATHHVVIQDDAVPCRQLVAGVHRILRHVPDGHPVGLYYGALRQHRNAATRLYERAARAGHRWVVMRQSPMWGVCLVYPTRHIDQLVAYCDQLRPPSYDGRVRHWYRQQRIDVWHPLPSLVDHRNGPENPSLTTGRHSDGRVAHEFIGRSVSPLDVDWDTPATR